MRRFILGWKHLGYERHLQAHIVNYADDFVIVCRKRAQEAYAAMARLMSILKLEINREKNPDLSSARRHLRLPGLHLLPLLLKSHRQGLPGNATEQKEDCCHQGKDQSPDKPSESTSPDSREGGATQRADAWLGQLFLPWSG